MLLHDYGRWGGGWSCDDRQVFFTYLRFSLIYINVNHFMNQIFSKILEVFNEMEMEINCH